MRFKKLLARLIGAPALDKIQAHTLSGLFKRLWYYNIYEDGAKEALRELRQFAPMVKCTVTFEAENKERPLGAVKNRYTGVTIDIDTNQMINLLIK